MRKTEKQEKKACRSEFQLLLPFLLSSFPDSFSSARFLDLRDESVKVRPFAGIEFGVERFTIGADFEGAAARWDEGKRRDPFAEVENLSRQTDGFRRVVSNRAILDPDFGFHRSLLSRPKLSTQPKRVNTCSEGWSDCLGPRKRLARRMKNVHHDLRFRQRLTLTNWSF